MHTTFKAKRRGTLVLQHVHFLQVHLLCTIFTAVFNTIQLGKLRSSGSFNAVGQRSWQHDFRTAMVQRTICTGSAKVILAYCVLKRQQRQSSCLTATWSYQSIMLQNCTSVLGSCTEKWQPALISALNSCTSKEALACNQHTNTTRYLED